MRVVHALSHWTLSTRDRFASSWPLQFWARLESIGFLDRSMTIAAQAFVALLPMVVLLSAAFSGGSGSAIADEMVRRFDLSGGAVAAVRSLLETPAGAQREVNILGIVVVLMSGVSLSRRLGRLYEAAWGLGPLGPRVLWRSFAWIVAVAAYLVLMSDLRNFLRAHVGWWLPAVIVAVFAGAFGLWWWTQHFFLAGRVGWRVLIPGALANAVGALGMIIYNATYMPEQLTSQASQFGPIGVAFGLFSYLFALAMTVVVSAVFGAWWAERHGYLSPLRPPIETVKASP